MAPPLLFDEGRNPIGQCPQINGVLMHMNMLPSRISETLLQYADNTTLVRSESDPSAIASAIN